MSVWRRYEGHGFPSLVTTNTADRKRIFSSREAVTRLIGVIDEVRIEEGFQVHAYVVMPDHLHMVLSIREGGTMKRVMQLIKGRFAWRHNRECKALGSVWQSRYERATRSDEQFNWAVEYVHYNPVAGGLVRCPEDYPWSSASPGGALFP